MMFLIAHIHHVEILNTFVTFLKEMLYFHNRQILGLLSSCYLSFTLGSLILQIYICRYLIEIIHDTLKFPNDKTDSSHSASDFNNFCGASDPVREFVRKVDGQSVYI